MLIHFCVFEKLSDTAVKQLSTCWYLANCTHFLNSFNLYCVFEKLSDTAVKTAVKTSWTLITFCSPTTLFFIVKSEKRVPPRVFKHFLCIWEITWYSCQLQTDHFLFPTILYFLAKSEKRVLPRLAFLAKFLVTYAKNVPAKFVPLQRKISPLSMFHLC